ncbi:MAG TPA: hypothetical protein VHA52_05125 [Candidatus Babeliaceae bacterium]|nr:hypothetical protein [Candidatus Babeliaceae bacterium]
MKLIKKLNLGFLTFLFISHSVLISCNVHNANRPNHLKKINRSYVSKNKNTKTEDSVSSNDTAKAVQRIYFEATYIKKLQTKLLTNKGRQIDTINLTSKSFIETLSNDTYYYLVFHNRKTHTRKVLLISSINESRSIFGNYIGLFGDYFIWGYGSSTSNRDWLMFDCNTGAFKVSGGSFMGLCAENDALFFINKNSILRYAAKKDVVSLVINLANTNKDYSRLNYYWTFICSDNKWLIIYQGKHSDTLEYSPMSSSVI